MTRLTSARHVAVLTGAGVSAESGLATFRDPDGAWGKVSPADMATLEGFHRDPVTVQRWYAARTAAALAAEPNPAHRALAALESLVPEFTLVTQNIDGLHQRAGSRNVLELHGCLRTARCVSCSAPADALGGDTFPQSCRRCGRYVRPDVVWFGEALPATVFERAARAADSCDVFLSIGTSAMVFPAAELPLHAARAGAYVAEINLAPSAIAERMDEALAGPAGSILPALLEHLRSARADASGHTGGSEPPGPGSTAGAPENPPEESTSHPE